MQGSAFNFQEKEKEGGRQGGGEGTMRLAKVISLKKVERPAKY